MSSKECINITKGMIVCIGDLIGVQVGRRYIQGFVKEFNMRYGQIVIMNDNHPVMVKVNKISSLEVFKSEPT